MFTLSLTNLNTMQGYERRHLTQAEVNHLITTLYADNSVRLNTSRNCPTIHADGTCDCRLIIKVMEEA